jgi:predicted metal-binding protein
MWFSKRAKNPSMRVAPAPRVHLFVCANRREAGSPLGEGCAARGEALYDSLKREVSARGLVTEAWVTKTHCLGICPKRGATVARYPGGDPITSEVEETDASALLEAALEAPGALDSLPWADAERELAASEELQSGKVLDLARRLKPGLTLEDIRNPHDFPELDDPDWHYADGVLTGIQSIATALRALKNRERG